MDKVSNGGPAFPSHGSMGEVTHEGATLRDYFAAKALVGALSNSDSGNGAMEPTMLYVASHPQEACDLLATFAYRLADAMLSARGAP